MNIIPIPAFKDNYIWLGYDLASKHCFVVDPGEAEPVLQTLSDLKLTLTEILITHHHPDHTGGVQQLTEMTKAVVYGAVNSKYPGVQVGVADGDSINLASVKKSVRVLAIPGHTLDHIAYYNEELLFCGDTLFSAGCGRVFEGTFEQMFTSLSKLAILPPATLVYCGHEYTEANLKFAAAAEPNNLAVNTYMAQAAAWQTKGLPTLPSTIEKELQVNPFLRTDSTEIIENIKEKFKVTDTAPMAVFTQLRKWKDNF